MATFRMDASRANWTVCCQFCRRREFESNSDRRHRLLSQKVWTLLILQRHTLCKNAKGFLIRRKEISSCRTIQVLPTTHVSSWKQFPEIMAHTTHRDPGG